MCCSVPRIAKPFCSILFSDRRRGSFGLAGPRLRVDELACSLHDFPATDLYRELTHNPRGRGLALDPVPSLLYEIGEFFCDREGEAGGREDEQFE